MKSKWLVQIEYGDAFLEELTIEAIDCFHAGDRALYCDGTVMLFSVGCVRGVTKLKFTRCHVCGKEIKPLDMAFSSSGIVSGVCSLCYQKQRLSSIEHAPSYINRSGLDGGIEKIK